MKRIGRSQMRFYSILIYLFFENYSNDFNFNINLMKFNKIK